ncbi:hypothetical protein AHF37_05667 [Paragonimus kellicotti]|nr:hypothetical protein AHF37_05667 [Paragonimus kellicotti]
MCVCAVSFPTYSSLVCCDSNCSSVHCKVLIVATIQMNLGQNCLLSKCGPGNITLEALLDSPGLTPSPLSEFVNDPAVLDANGVGSCSLLQQQRLQPHTSVCTPLAVSSVGDNSSALTRKLFASELQRQTLLRDYCIELLFVLRNQDVNGYFLSSAQGSGHMKDVNRIGLLDLEKRLLCNGYHTLDEFKSDVAQLFVWALRQYSPDTPAHAEAQRLNNLASDWFSSLAADHVAALNSTLTRQPAHVISQVPADVAEEQILPTETTLGILNPDNHGVVSRTERVRSIGEERITLRLFYKQSGRSVTSVTELSETYPSGSNSPDLTESASDLISLYQTQYRRLGDTSPTSAMTGATLRPSQTETTIAHRLVGRLIRLAKRARPGDLVHPLAVRRAMNVLPNIAPLPDDEYLQDNCLSFSPVTTQANPRSGLSVTGAS